MRDGKGRIFPSLSQFIVFSILVRDRKTAAGSYDVCGNDMRELRICHKTGNWPSAGVTWESKKDRERRCIYANLGVGVLSFIAAD